MTTMTRPAPTLAGRARKVRPWVTAVLVSSVAMFALRRDLTAAAGGSAEVAR